MKTEDFRKIYGDQVDHARVTLLVYLFNKKIQINSSDLRKPEKQPMVQALLQDLANYDTGFRSEDEKTPHQYLVDFVEICIRLRDGELEDTEFGSGYLSSHTFGQFQESNALKQGEVTSVAPTKNEEEEALKGEFFFCLNLS